MARDTEAKCRKCRRAMEKLFLKGDRCFSPKCALTRKNYFPGMHGKKGSRGLSEYGKQLMTKQKIKRAYGILERQFRKHFDEVKGKPGIIGDLLLIRLEKRLDNVVFRSGLASSRPQARQLVGHGLIAVNGKKMTIPSFEVRIGDIIAFKEGKKEKNYWKNKIQTLKNKKDFPAWINFDASKMESRIVGLPSRDETGINADAQIVVEYYSR